MTKRQVEVGTLWTMAGGRTRLRRVTVDLTPLLPGGENGGAKLVARALVRELGRLAPDIEFTLLTPAASHAECADLDAANVRRECVEFEPRGRSPEGVAFSATRAAARAVVNTLLPTRARATVKDRVWALLKRRQRTAITRNVRPDLIFCPFTAPYFFDPDIPLVAIVYDLQYVDLPGMFDERLRRNRHENFVDACHRADRLICISEFVRQTVLANSRVLPGSVQTIPLTVLHATHRDAEPEALAHQLLRRLGLSARRFLFYPANVWPHKNHRALVEAFSMHRRRWPDSDLALVCSGAPSAAADELDRFARECLPPGSFAFAGYLPEYEFSALLQSCRALIFPSLYEGFGLPVLEAMACERPVLCSNVTSLPEIAGDAALLFDPHNTSSIADAIQRLETEPELEGVLVNRGRQRVANFGTARDMAAHYLTAFEAVAADRSGTQRGRPLH